MATRTWNWLMKCLRRSSGDEIFISYRVQDSKWMARDLARILVSKFGPEHVFFDKYALGLGLWWPQISAALDRAKCVLVVIGPTWLTAADRNNPRRLDDPSDVHRREIERALQRQDVLIIPVCFDNMQMPNASDLPEALRGLALHQALAFPESMEDSKYDELLERIVHRTELTVRAEPGSTDDGKPSPVGIVASALLAFLLTVALQVPLEYVWGVDLGSFAIFLAFSLVFAVVYFGSRSRAFLRRR